MFLVLKDFEIRYPDFKVTVESLELELGSVTAVVGSNGSGKTTFIEGVLGVQLGVSGLKRWGTGEATLDKKVSGVQLQRSGFGDQMLVKEICLLHKALYKKVDSAFYKDFQIEELLSKQYRNLSRGQKQRVDLFVAMGHLPTQLFLDEPKTGLDSAFSTIFMRYFKSFTNCNENSAIFACHSPEELMIADSILWLEGGKVKDFGLKKALFKKHLGDYKVELKNLSDEQRDDYHARFLSLSMDTKEHFLSDDSLTMYGDLSVKEWAEQTIHSDAIQEYSISSVREADFLEYLTKKNN